MRTTISRSSLLLAIAVGASMAPAAVRAQAAVPDTARAARGTHTVKTGDTLWDLARRYLADPFLWPEIYRLNTDVVEDPHWIYPGETLRLPGGAPAPVASNAEPVDATGSTVFTRVAQSSRVDRATGRLDRGVHATVRAGEFIAAPYADREGGPGGAGKIIAVADIAGADELDPQYRIGANDRVYVTLPAGSTRTEGERLLTYALGPSLTSGGQVVVPTGIVEVEHVGGNSASTARLVQAFGSVMIAQGVLPIDSLRLFSTARPTAVTGGTDAKVMYVQGDHVLTSMQNFLVLSPQSGSKAGDQYTLYRPATSTVHGDALPDEVVGVAQVVRVTPFGASAMVIHVSQPAIKNGMPARLTARMP